MRNDNPHYKKGITHEFVYCSCTREEAYTHKVCCSLPEVDFFTIGRLRASPLSGFIAGVIAATIMFLPWLFILAKIW
ncbi:MAG: hypothetical protein RLZZ324_932 [Candidatus Parcubacteria bacterium]|jgi:hypothetical protein